jgi:tRNA(fMet)-specific endonuclease VapC
MRLILDTNRYDDLNRGITEAVQVIATASEIWVPLIVLGELRAGFVGGSQTAPNEQLLLKFLSKPATEVLLPDASTSEFYTFDSLRRSGTPIPTNDIWIAALASQHNLPIYSRDRHFQVVPGEQLV